MDIFGKNNSPSENISYDEIEKTYDYLSKYWKNEPNGAKITEAKPLLKMLGNVENKNILDAGCGSGQYSIDLAKKGADVFGIDFSQGMINHAKRNAKKNGADVVFKKANICSLPFEDSFFDKIIVARVFGFLDETDMECAAKEIMRVLKKNGETVVSVIHPDCGNSSNLSVNNKVYRMPKFCRTLDEYKNIFSKFGGNIVLSEELQISEEFKKINPISYGNLKGKNFILIFKLKK